MSSSEFHHSNSNITISMKVGLYKYVLAGIALFLYFVSTRLYKEATTINEDTILNVFNELDGDHNGVLSKKEQAFIRYCAKNVSIDEIFGTANSKQMTLKEFQLGIRPFSSSMALFSAKCGWILPRSAADPHRPLRNRESGRQAAQGTLQRNLRLEPQRQGRLEGVHSRQQTLRNRPRRERHGLHQQGQQLGFRPRQERNMTAKIFVANLSLSGQCCGFCGFQPGVDCCGSMLF